jgi:phage FluMu protein Com
MRISEQRYSRDRRALDVATRLIDFEARTGTIRALTGLADDRIRKLSKTCGTDGRSTSAPRHRGSSKRRVGHLLGRSQSKEAAALLGVCQLMGITSESRSPERDPGSSRVARAEQLCDAFWTFRYLLPQASMSFELMLLLLSEVAKGEEIAATNCRSCNALLVVDILSLYDSQCPHCAELSPMTRRPRTTIPYRCVAEEAPAYT